LEDQTAWLKEIADRQAKKAREERDDALELDRDELVALLWDRWRQRQTLDVFVQERRQTQLWYAMRECDAVDLSTELGEHRWDHSACDHSKRLMAERAEVRTLPDAVIEKVQDAIDGVTINPRAAGNSDAPASSSGSSEPASAEAEDSTPSTPAAT
jgi:hypothetical protein